MKLYVKGIVRKPNDTLYTFLNRVLNLNGGYFERSTVNATYLDLELKELQCNAGKHRSFDDLVLIAKTYFRVSDKAVAKAIVKILNKNDTFLFVLCDSAEKWVLNRNLTKSNKIKYCGAYNKSDLNTDDYSNGDYSFDDIITLAGLTKDDIKINN